MTGFDIRCDEDGRYRVYMQAVIGAYDTLDEARNVLSGIRLVDEVRTVRPQGNSKTVRIGRELTEAGAEIGDAVRVMVLVGADV